ncbi:MAG TPA: phosphotransferase family protein [Candidatus Binataceae bacterium]|nr:phosphotransferase family protein [Candidatus Binataceae bacterium]
MTEAETPHPAEDEYGEVRDEEQLDWAKLTQFLRGKIPGVDRPLAVKQFRGGHSNLTYLLRYGDTEWVVRRPPFGPLPVGGHDMAREFRVLSKLWQSYPPAPRALVFSDDASIIGAPFFVMERRSGIVIKNREPLPRALPQDPASLRKLSTGFVDAMADLHAVAYQKIGLGDLGKPEGFMQRQTAGWMRRWESAKTREVPLMEKLGAWFLDHQPPPQPPTIIHNDFYLHNVMIDSHDPGRVAGVFDWEMSTIGEPLIDLGLALNYWRGKDDLPELLNAPNAFNHTLTPGFMTRDELIERYAQRSRRDVSNILFFWAWAHWKNATVGEQIYVRYVRGQTHDPRFASFATGAPLAAESSARVARRIGFPH